VFTTAAKGRELHQAAPRSKKGGAPPQSPNLQYLSHRLNGCSIYKLVEIPTFSGIVNCQFIRGNANLEAGDDT